MTNIRCFCCFCLTFVLKTSSGRQGRVLWVIQNMTKLKKKLVSGTFHFDEMAPSLWLYLGTAAKLQYPGCSQGVTRTSAAAAGRPDVRTLSREESKGRETQGCNGSYLDVNTPRIWKERWHLRNNLEWMLTLLAFCRSCLRHLPSAFINYRHL